MCNLSQMKECEMLDFEDLVILKQFLEKGFRKKIFEQNEIEWANKEHAKLTRIIQYTISKHNQILPSKIS